jgi:hypothetical protein
MRAHPDRVCDVLWTLPYVPGTTVPVQWPYFTAANFLSKFQEVRTRARLHGRLPPAFG